MNAYLLTAIIHKIRSDKEHQTDRRLLHETYEWLENFWRNKYRKGNNSIDDFINEKAHFFWQKPEIKYLAIQFASIECVGSNEKPEYTQSSTIANATMYLRFYCNLFNGELHNCNSILCRHHKINTGRCTIVAGGQWSSIINDECFAFKALMYIIRQVRNNLFHGHKMTLEPEQFYRDKILISLSAQTTTYLLENLIGSEG